MDRVEPPPVTVFTFFLELPRALPMSADYLQVSGDRADEHWEGWLEDDIAKILDSHPSSPLPPGFVPKTATAISHFKATSRLPLLAVEEAFADWFDGPLLKSAYEETRKWAEPEGSDVRVMKTMVALSRFIPRSAHPLGPEMTAGWLHTQFQLALEDFNGLLEALGFVMGRWDVGPLALRDLPAQIPVLITNTKLVADGAPEDIMFIAEIHDAVAVHPDEFAPDWQATGEAIELNHQAHNGEQPYMEVLRFMRAAESERLPEIPHARS